MLSCLAPALFLCAHHAVYSLEDDMSYYSVLVYDFPTSSFVANASFFREADARSHCNTLRRDERQVAIVWRDRT